MLHKKRPMGDLSSFIILLLCLVVFTFVRSDAFGFESCPDKVRTFCECFYPFFTIRCSHKLLKDYPDFVGVQVKTSVFLRAFHHLSFFIEIACNLFT